MWQRERGRGRERERERERERRIETYFSGIDKIRHHR